MLRSRILFNYSIFLILLVIFIFFQHGNCYHNVDYGRYFAKTSGTHFEVNGKPLYLNGFNAYWLMVYAAEPSSMRDKVTTTFQLAAEKGMNVARTWGFNDGGHDKPLQYSPGKYNEKTFQGLDFVIAEARKHRIYLIISLVNNFDAYGGRKQYKEWGIRSGQYIENEDGFYTNTVVKQYYKNHIKAVLTRINTISGVAYKDDPTILAWELMNEPRCPSDPSGKIVQEWIEEMSAYVKSIDNNHLLEIGLEGFYGESEKSKNPHNSLYGTDFISNNQISGVDFATIHIYPESWLTMPSNSSYEAQLTFAKGWIKTHIQDTLEVLKKPLVIGEFGKSSKNPNFNLEKRNYYFKKVYDDIYDSVKQKGPCVGGIFWQLMTKGMASMGDGYEVILEGDNSTAAVIAQQSERLFQYMIDCCGSVGCGHGPLIVLR